MATNAKLASAEITRLKKENKQLREARDIYHKAWDEIRESYYETLPKAEAWDRAQPMLEAMGKAMGPYLKITVESYDE